jgi:CRISPR/Cas system CMR-associated protein Cmr5 small subunit
MRVTQDLNSFGEIIAHAQCSVDEKKNIYIPYVPHKIFNVMQLILVRIKGHIKVILHQFWVKKISL